MIDRYDFRADAVEESRLLLATSDAPEYPLRAGISLCLPREDDLGEAGVRRLRRAVYGKPLLQYPFYFLAMVVFWVVYMIFYYNFGAVGAVMGWVVPLLLAGAVLTWKKGPELFYPFGARRVLLKSIAGMDSEWAARHGNNREFHGAGIYPYQASCGYEDLCVIIPEPELERVVLIGYRYLYVIQGRDVLDAEVPERALFSVPTYFDIQCRVGRALLGMRLSPSQWVVPSDYRRATSEVAEEMLLALGIAREVERFSVWRMLRFW